MANPGRAVPVPCQMPIAGRDVHVPIMPDPIHPAPPRGCHARQSLQAPLYCNCPLFLSLPLLSGTFLTRPLPATSHQPAQPPPASSNQSAQPPPASSHRSPDLYQPRLSRRPDLYQPRLIGRSTFACVQFSSFTSGHNHRDLGYCRDKLSSPTIEPFCRYTGYFGSMIHLVCELSH